MSSRDNIANSQLVFLGTLTLSGATPAASAWVDTLGFDSASLIVKTNTVTDAGTAAGFSFVLQESNLKTAVSATTVATAETLGDISDLTVTDNDDDDKLIGAVGYAGNKQYVRLDATGTAGTNATVDVYAMLCHPHRAETTFVGTSVAAT